MFGAGSSTGSVFGGRGASTVMTRLTTGAAALFMILSILLAKSGSDHSAVEAAALAFMQDHVPKGASPMCGNSIGQDRRFMARYMPQLEDWFLYRNLDVSTLKELCRRWKPEVAKGFVKKGEHTALADIRESIAELAYYREHFIKL